MHNKIIIIFLKILKLEKKDYSKIRLSLKKPFIKSDEYGWSWHKSWNIPTIQIEIDVKFIFF